MMRGGRNSPLPGKFIDPFKRRSLGQRPRREPSARAQAKGSAERSGRKDYRRGANHPRTILSKVEAYAGESKD